MTSPENIIEAYERGDGDTLDEIERLGVGFLDREPEPEPQPDCDGYEASRTVTSAFSEKLKRWVWFLAPFWFPYALAFAIRSWDQNRKT